MRGTDSTFRRRRVVKYFAGFVAAGLLAISGCGKGGLRTYPVTGTVLVDGRPAEGAMLIFCPVAGSQELQKKRPSGTSGPDGKFQLTTDSKDDGAPAGEYKIIAQWYGKVGKDKFGRPAVEGEDRFRGKYMNLDKTEFKATVNEGATELPPIELKSK